MNFCPNCGAKLLRPGEDQFCTNCGAKIPVVVPGTDAAPVFSGVPVPPLPAQEVPAPPPAPPKGEDILNLIEQAQAGPETPARLWGEAEVAQADAADNLFAEAETETAESAGPDLFAAAQPPPAQPDMFDTAEEKPKLSVQEIFMAAQREMPATVQEAPPPVFQPAESKPPVFHPQENPKPVFKTQELPLLPEDKPASRQHSAPARRRAQEPPPPRPPAGPRLMREAASEDAGATAPYRATPAPPPTPLPPQEEYIQKRSIGGRILTGLAILLVFLVVCAGTILVMLYFQNRPSQTIDAFTDAIAAEDYAKLDELTRMQVNGAAPASVQWQAFCAAFEDESALNELQSQLNKIAEGETGTAHPYPAVSIESRPFILFIQRYTIEVSTVDVLAQGASDGSTLMLDETAAPGTPQEGGQLFSGLMPGQYQLRLVPPGIEPQNVPAEEILLFGAAGGAPYVLDAGVPSVAVTISNCASDDAILYVNDEPVAEKPLGGVVTIPNVAVGSTIRISAIKDGVTMEAGVVFADLNTTQLAFADYTSQGEPAPPADSSDTSAPEEGGITATNASTLLGAFYQSYLSCINSQSMNGIQGTTQTANTAIAGRITSSNNAANLFEYAGVSCDEESIQVVSDGVVHLNAKFDYTYKPRDTEEAYAPASNTQSVELVLQDGQWLVNKIEFVSEGDFNNHVIAAFPA